VATIREIATRLGISLSTVSTVINNSGYVSPGMRERVEQALREVNYHPNQVARSLRRGETRTMGLIVPDLANSFYSDLLRGTEDYLASVGYRLIVADSREDWRRQQDYLTGFFAQMTDGIMLVPCLATDEQIESIPRIVGGTPLVYVDRSPLHSPVDTVLIDNVQACCEATRHLIELGHHRIGIITEPLNLLSATDRLEGYRRAIRSGGLKADTKLIRIGDNTKRSGYQNALDLLKVRKRPTALVTCNNLMALGVLIAVRELRLRCPRDISIVTFDDSDWSEHLNPPLTTLCQPAEEMGATAAKTLMKKRGRTGPDSPARILLPVRLVVRGSSAPPRH
jgi:LacI family transcriptional regulator